ncbi:G2/M phase-specific E3 ubiquitin-protein ligase-like [Mytilus californianus]|uniref:G2/M phase-specific E3 ubiquitin-protein ligase-like n=1 Tax=Mytilus californianus TaxID=6549 RepID=UPI002246F524|nr:G2/M phase-specific E3 ubiquitin-protein ligase-like [Mytilus californianus]
MLNFQAFESTNFPELVVVDDHLQETEAGPGQEQQADALSYVQLFETEIVTVDDSDDEGDKTIPMDVDISLPELLIKLQSQVALEKITKFNINRNLVLDGARRAIKRKSFCAKSKISVKFTDDVGIAEGAIDEGRPKREFLRMLMKKIQYLHIFEGPENRRILAYSTSALEDNLYRDVGLFFSLSIVHGGPSPKFLSPAMYNALVGQAGERNIEDKADGDLRGEVQKVVFRKYWIDNKNCYRK